MSAATFQPIENETAAATARYALEQALLPTADNPAEAAFEYDVPAEPWELWLGDQLLGPIVTGKQANYAFTVEWGKLIFAWWDETHSQNWRVTSVALAPGELCLRATRGLGQTLVTLTLRQPLRHQLAQAANDVSLAVARQRYASALPQWLQAQFPAARVLSVTSSQRRQQIPSIGYTKIKLRSGTELVLAIGVCAAETQTTIDAIITAGLVWLHKTNEARSARQPARRLLFCVPANRATTILERLTFLTNPQAELPAGRRFECWLVNEQTGELAQAAAHSQPELLNAHSSQLSWPTPVEPHAAQQRWLERISQLAPDSIEIRPSQLPTNTAVAWQCLWNGLEFARISPLGRATFGIAGAAGYEPQPLTEQNFASLSALVQALATYRNGNRANQQHPLYRLRSEAWLEACLRRDITALALHFDARFVYSQIPAWQAESRAVLDLLTVTQTGRLAVIEIKASEDGQLPMQGLDYWWRIEQARLRDDFAQRGLFSGIKLLDQPPLLYLVAPRLRFHRSFVTVARSLAPIIETYRIGLNANWRTQLRVVDCERVN